MPMCSFPSFESRFKEMDSVSSELRGLPLHRALVLDALPTKEHLQELVLVVVDLREPSSPSIVRCIAHNSTRTVCSCRISLTFRDSNPMKSFLLTIVQLARAPLVRHRLREELGIAARLRQVEHHMLHEDTS